MEVMRVVPINVIKGKLEALDWHTLAAGQLGDDAVAVEVEL